MTTFDSDLNPVLEMSSNEDLMPLVEYILTARGQKLSSSGVYKANKTEPQKYTEDIAREIRSFGGSALANLARGAGPSYREVLHGLAGRLGATHQPDANAEELELAVLLRLFGESWNDLPENERAALLEGFGVKEPAPKQGKLPLEALAAVIRPFSFAAYKLAALVADSFAKSLLGKGIAPSPKSLAPYLAVLAGPIGWSFAGIWAIKDLSGPSYRALIPCVAHVAMLRQKLALLSCSTCGAERGSHDEPCANCGAAAQSAA